MSLKLLPQFYVEASKTNIVDIEQYNNLLNQVILLEEKFSKLTSFLNMALLHFKTIFEEIYYHLQNTALLSSKNINFLQEISQKINKPDLLLDFQQLQNANQYFDKQNKDLLQ